MFRTILLFTQAVYASQDFCRALSLSGGGAKGSYEPGALVEMAKHFEGTDEMRYDVISGVSVGSINAGLLSLFPKGSEVEMAQFLYDCWFNLSNEDIWEYWNNFKIIDFFEAVFKYPSLLNNKPLEDYLEKKFDEKNREVFRKVVLGATDLQTGGVVVIDYDDLEPQDYVKAIIGSSSVPAVFPFKHFKGKLLIDGGTSWNLNMIVAFKKCMEMVDNDPSRIILDVIVMFTNDVTIEADKNYNSIQNFLRMKTIRDQYKVNNDITEFMQAYPTVQYRYFVQPHEQILPDFETLNFSHENIIKGLRMGKEDARNSLLMGPGESFRQFSKSLNNGSKKKSVFLN